MTTTTTPPPKASGATDFDFLFGQWTIRHRKLDARLQGCDEWTEFDAEYECRPIIAGLGNLDSMRTTIDGEPFEGNSIRLFDAATRLWSIYWVDSKNPALGTPVVGRFDGNVGVFSATEVIGDRTFLVRFIWTRIDAERARWEQAFSPDLGEIWETNWVMEFTRL